MAAENLRIGDVEAYIDYADGNGEQFLGETKGGVEFMFEREFEDLTVDKYGNSPLDMALTGNDLKIKIFLAEPTTENIGRAVPEGRYDEGSASSKLGLGTKSGYRLLDDAGLLRLHPRANASSDKDEDIYIWKAVSSEPVELPFKVDEQRVLEVTFRALVDETKSDGEHLGRVGDEPIS